MAQDWITLTYQALQKTWVGFIDFLPRLLGSLILFIIGWFIAVAVEQITVKILEKLRFNRLFERTGWKEALEKAEFKMNPSEFIGVIFKWILVIVFLLVAVEILGLAQFAGFLRSVIAWLPNLVVAVSIFVVAAVAADILAKITVAALEKTRVDYARLAGKIVRWAIWVFALLAILFQLGVVRPLIETLFTGLMAGFAIAFGIAFGWGGKEMAADLLEDWRRHIRRER